MEPVFNQYEQQLDDITHANWDTQYLSNEARVKERIAFLQYKIGGMKIGSLLGRICKLLHLNCFECVRKFFSCSDLQAASLIIKDTIKLINDRTCPPPSTLTMAAKQALFERVTLVFNNLFDSVNAKRYDAEKLSPSLPINLVELLSDGRPDSGRQDGTPSQNTPSASSHSPETSKVAEPSVITATENTDAAEAPKPKTKERRKNTPHAPVVPTTRKSTRLATKSQKT